MFTAELAKLRVECERRLVALQVDNLPEIAKTQPE
jgi:hypothetical protein